MQVNSEVRRIIHMGPDKAIELPELEEIVRRVSGSDDLWFKLGSGYIQPEDILEDQDDIDDLNRAINLIKEFENIIDQITLVEE